MKHIDYGLSIFSRYSFHRVLDGYYCDLADVHDTMLSMEELAAFEVYNRFYEVGSFSGIQQFKNYLEGN
jgi:predicted trehalose synthase